MVIRAHKFVLVKFFEKYTLTGLSLKRPIPSFDDTVFNHWCALGEQKVVRNLGDFEFLQSRPLNGKSYLDI